MLTNQITSQVSFEQFGSPSDFGSLAPSLSSWQPTGTHKESPSVVSNLFASRKVILDIQDSTPPASHLFAKQQVPENGTHRRHSSLTSMLKQGSFNASDCLLPTLPQSWEFGAPEDISPFRSFRPNYSDVLEATVFFLSPHQSDPCSVQIQLAGHMRVEHLILEAISRLNVDFACHEGGRGQVSKFELRVARKNGAPKEDLPVLDVRQPLNALGATRFALVPVRRSAPAIHKSTSIVAASSPSFPVGACEGVRTHKKPFWSKFLWFLSGCVAEEDY
eukprot:GILK01003082.1.p1 GENE.GILK01003082.1~~GILK01003082.1.p1  ORF type:complete len:276 (-),score=40.69 GILK01003082.1:242-1069(-)